MQKTQSRTSTATSPAGARELHPCRVAELRIGDSWLRNLDVYLTPHLPEEPENRDAILPLGLFRALYFGNSGNLVIINPQLRKFEEIGPLSEIS